MTKHTPHPFVRLSTLFCRSASAISLLVIALMITGCATQFTVPNGAVQATPSHLVEPLTEATGSRSSSNASITRDEIRLTSAPEIENTTPLPRYRAIAYIQRVDLPLEASLNQAWQFVDEGIIQPRQRELWNVNGLRIGMLDRNIFTQFRESLPDRAGGRRIEIDQADAPRPIHISDRLQKRVTIQLSPPNEATDTYDSALGRMQMLARVDYQPLAGTPLSFELLPHHNIPGRRLDNVTASETNGNRQFDVQPRTANERALDGRFLEQLALRLVPSEDRFLVIGLNQPWPEQRQMRVEEMEAAALQAAPPASQAAQVETPVAEATEVVEAAKPTESKEPERELSPIEKLRERQRLAKERREAELRGETVTNNQRTTNAAPAGNRRPRVLSGIDAASPEQLAALLKEIRTIERNQQRNQRNTPPANASRQPVAPIQIQPEPEPEPFQPPANEPLPFVRVEPPALEHNLGNVLFTGEASRGKTQQLLLISVVLQE